jgi:hypothetical protein
MTHVVLTRPLSRKAWGGCALRPGPIVTIRATLR